MNRSLLLDGLAVAAIAEELSAWVGARIQDVVQPDRLSLSLELYLPGLGRSHLLLSASPERQGVRLDQTRSRRGAGASSPLSQFAQAHIAGGRLVSVRQPGWERILHFGFAQAGGAMPVGRGRGAGAPWRESDASWIVVAELMGRMANIVVVDSGGVARAVARPVTAAMTRARTVLPGERYEPPPPQHRADPCGVTAEDIGASLAEAARRGEPAWRTLVRDVAGASPLSSREIVFRATGGAEAEPKQVAPDRVLAALRAVYRCDGAGWVPSVAMAGGQVVAYAPYALTHLEGAGAESALAALARFEDSALNLDGYAAARRAVAEGLTRSRTAVERRVAALERQAQGADQSEIYRRKADLILAHQSTLAPRQRSFTAAYAPDEPEMVIALDPALTGAANAEAYYSRYRKARRAGEGLAARKAEAAAALEFLDQMAFDLDQAPDRAAIDAVQEALRGAGLDPRGGKQSGKPAPARPAGGPLRWVSKDGFTIWVGRNSRQNELVTFSRGAKGDPWLHARGVPGAHVVVKAAGRVVPESTIEEAGAVAAWFSRQRDSGAAEVTVTDVRYVKRHPSGRPGMVTVDHERTIMVRPEAPADPVVPLDPKADKSA